MRAAGTRTIVAQRVINSTPAPADDELAAPPQVLLVDDDEVILLVVSAALRDRGFAVTQVTSGEAALQHIAGEIPDVLVLDAMMPGLDGFETCRVLRGRAGFESLPVLMLTGLDDDASISRAYEAGATDFFVKSNQWNLLAGRLRYLLRASRTRSELERSKSKLARAQDLARMGSFDWKFGAAAPQFSVEAARVLGLGTRNSPSLRRLLHLLSAEDRASLMGMLREVVKHSSVLTTDVAVTQKSGRRRIVRIEAEPEFAENGLLVGYTGIVQDLTDRRTAEDKIRRLANFDTLTALPNRRQLIWRVERALEYARSSRHQVALLLIDLDRFKIINDTLGHAAGDELLLEVSRRLKKCVRHSDQVTENGADSSALASHHTLEAVARLNGDEFMALLPEVIDAREAELVATRILDLMREPVIVGGQECFVTASVGISMFPRDGENAVDLMRNADVAMQAVKVAGRNAVSLYSPSLAGRGRAMLELESALHKAIERDELVLHYQPKIDVRSARMVGAEALMRWNHGGELISPGDFIPLAEESGLIVPLSEWVVREAARQARVWKDSFGFGLTIAVNLPTRIFERTDLVELIHGAVTACGVPHGVIELEITETGLMKDLHNVIPTLHRLNEIGVQISIDDFGTGYSSLAYLTTLPISELKIDRSFVRDLGSTPQSSAVVTAIIALARSLDLRVVAEGVENLRQMEVLRRLGCGIMQGFLFSGAKPASEIDTWLRQTVLPRKAPWIAATGDEAADPPLMVVSSRTARVR
jgi:predicted signal transduction protein with EAL and GGDEF domain/DNA-binding response OmpR family regulator